MIHHRAVGDHHSGRVAALRADQPFEPDSEIEGLADRFVGEVAVAEITGTRVRVVTVQSEALHERGVAPHVQSRHQRCQLRRPGVRAGQDPGGVLGRLPGPDHTERAELGDSVVAVHVAEMVDDTVAVTVLEVHVDVRHRHTVGVEEPFEQQVVADRVDTDNTEAVRDRAAGR